MILMQKNAAIFNMLHSFTVTKLYIMDLIISFYVLLIYFPIYVVIIILGTSGDISGLNIAHGQVYPKYFAIST